MKKVFLLLILLVSLTINAQSFEGYIVYKNEVVSKNTNVSSSQYLNLVGSMQKSFYNSKGDYLNAIKDGAVRIQYYKNEENMLYNLFAANDTLYYKRVNFNKDPAIRYVLNEKRGEVLGNSRSTKSQTSQSGTTK